MRKNFENTLIVHFDSHLGVPPNMQLKTLIRKLTPSDRHKRHTFCCSKSCAPSVDGLTSCYVAEVD